ncbi:MAG: phosphoribosylanthranilate isomerase [Pelagibacterales bacterium]|nr:phosphoribosylanthranilate isomerase [Pelagibacterales bacterium]
MKIKLCGFKDQQSVLAAVSCGADFIGFVFCEKSPRYITPEEAGKIAQVIPNKIAKVAVFSNNDLSIIKQVYQYLKPEYFQFHGNETPGFLKKIKEIFPQVKIIKAFKIGGRQDLRQIRNFENESDLFLLDSKTVEGGGSGKSFDWRILVGFRARRMWFLSGGINIDNVLQASKIANAQMIDVSSGIEKIRGEKSVELIQQLTAKVKNYHAK